MFDINKCNFGGKMITVSSDNYKKFGKCINISNGEFELKVTTEIGPRIIFFGLSGGENIMFEDECDKINKGGEFFDTNLPNKGIWHIYGGHRLWKSPEDLATYYPDNEQVQVELLPNGGIFTSPIELTTGIQKTIKITMADDGSVQLEHTFKNCGDTITPKISLWTLNVLDKGAVTTLPLSTQDTGLLPNRNLVFWSYSDINDSRLQLFQDKVVINWKDIEQPFKIGATITQPIKVITKGLEFVVTAPYDVNGEYPDYCCNTEIYTNNLMMEVETISDMQQLKVGETKTHIENWTLKKA